MHFILREEPGLDSRFGGDYFSPTEAGVSLDTQNASFKDAGCFNLKHFIFGPELKHSTNLYMRLGQLARKLAVRPIEIVNFLAFKDILVEDGSNTRIEDDHVAMIVRKFAPERAEALLAHPNTAESADDEAHVHVERIAPIHDEPTGELANAEAEKSPDGVKPEEKLELIKASKIELSGLKVLGKIDLPETKKKESPPADLESPGESTPAEPGRNPWPPERKTYPQRRDRQNSPPRKNPIALQREREETEAEERKRAQIERDKEKRALHYRKKVKEAPPTKRVKMVEEPVEELPASELIEPPKTWWGKFLRWLNT